MISRMFVLTPVLGQAGSLAPLAVEWSLDTRWWAWALLFAALLAMFGVLVYSRRFAVADPEDSTSANLARLEQARADGLLTRDEYRRARRALLADVLPEESPPAGDDEMAREPPDEDADDESPEGDEDD